MDSTFFTRRNFSVRLATLFAGLGIVGNSRGATVGTRANSFAGNEISRAAESIHQEIAFKASRKRVYEALTQADQFTKVIGLSKFSGDSAAVISREAGGAFSLFGGHIVGRHIELVPNERLVQAWRAANWERGVYSIVRFDLKEQGDQTRIIFDHTGFPNGQAEHLLEGWNSHYWEPLQKYLAQAS
jgi:uncharacterized protein YndB with AHSA1/START domain